MVGRWQACLLALQLSCELVESETTLDAGKMEALESGQKAMEDPKMQEKMELIKTVMGSKELAAKLMSPELKSDPELQPMFEDLKKVAGGGMNELLATMQKYMQDDKLLAKLGDRIGDMPEEVMEKVRGSVGTVAGAKGIDTNNFVDAARDGNVEVVDEFLAAGEDVDTVDPETRSALHFAAGAGHMPVVKSLIMARAAGAVRSECSGKNCRAVVDAEGNTPLYYAAGYGHVPIVLALLEAGARATANFKGQSPADAARVQKGNPVAEDPALMERLEVSAHAEL